MVKDLGGAAQGAFSIIATCPTFVLVECSEDSFRDVCITDLSLGNLRRLLQSNMTDGGYYARCQGAGAVIWTNNRLV